MSSLRLEIRNISQSFRRKRFGRSKTTVFDDISFSVQTGETFGIMGPSGSGKTTLAKIICGLEKPAAGEVRFGGQDIRRLAGNDFRVFRRGVQLMFQNPESSLNPRKTVGKTLDEILRLIGTPPMDLPDLIGDMLETVGLSEEFLGRYPHQLSGGQNQRIVLARLLFLNPRFIILDEPTSALDISVQAQILQLLKNLQLRKKLGYVLISHDSRVVRFMSYKIGIIENKTMTIV